MKIKDNYKKIMGTIERACMRVDREPSEVQILGVAKDQPVERIREAYKCNKAYR